MPRRQCSCQPVAESPQFAPPSPESWHRGVQQQRPDRGVQARTLSANANLRSSNAPDLLPLKQLFNPKSQGILPERLQGGRLVGDDRPGFFCLRHGCQNDIAAVDAIEPQADIQ